MASAASPLDAGVRLAADRAWFARGRALSRTEPIALAFGWFAGAWLAPKVPSGHEAVMLGIARTRRRGRPEMPGPSLRKRVRLTPARSDAAQHDPRLASTPDCVEYLAQEPENSGSWWFAFPEQGMNEPQCDGKSKQEGDGNENEFHRWIASKARTTWARAPERQAAARSYELRRERPSPRCRGVSQPNVWRQWRAKRVHCTPGLGWAVRETGGVARTGAV